MRTLRLRTSAALPACALALLLAAAPPARAEGAPDEDRIRRLEEALERQRATTDRLRADFDAYRAANPAVARLTEDEIHASVDAYLAASAPADFRVVGDPAGRGGMRWGGYLSFEFHAPSDSSSYFDVYRLVLRGEAAVADFIDFEMEVEIENGGVTDEVPGEVALEQAELSFHVSDAFTPIVGAILIPFGRYNLQHDDPMNDFTDRPFTARFLVPTGFSQPGIGAEGSVPFGCGHTFAYKVALTNGYRDDFNAVEGVRDARQPWDADENDGKQVWGRGAATWKTAGFDRLETGLSGTWGLYDREDEHALTGVGLDVLARKGPFELQAEYLRQDYERGAEDPPGAVEGQWAVYAQVAWHFFPGFRSCRRGAFRDDTSLFTLAARYEFQDLDDRVRGASFEDDLEAWTVGLNYRLTERTVFRLDWTLYRPAVETDRDAWAFSVATYF